MGTCMGNRTSAVTRVPGQKISRISLHSAQLVILTRKNPPALFGEVFSSPERVQENETYHYKPRTLGKAVLQVFMQLQNR